MLDRDGYIAGVPCWIDTSQPDPEAAKRFYGGLFGWTFEERSPQYFVAQLGGRDVAGIGGPPEPGPPTPMWSSYVWVDSADAAAASVAKAGGRVLAEPFDVEGAGRMAVLADPAGAVFCVWEAGGHNGAQAVNEPGSWNFSELNTGDVEGAKAFYGSVFGWEPSPLGAGGEMTWFWRVPGYGDFLEQRDPGMRARMADVGAPEGFEDAVAWLVPAGDDGAPPHWSITFAVDDADAIADRAAELGGTVVSPPVDTEWVRTTVIRDPQGATFTASRFTPPA